MLALLGMKPRDIDPQVLKALETLSGSPAFSRYAAFIQKQSADADRLAIMASPEIAEIMRGRARAYREMLELINMVKRGETHG